MQVQRKRSRSLEWTMRLRHLLGRCTIHHLGRLRCCNQDEQGIAIRQKPSRAKAQEGESDLRKDVVGVILQRVCVQGGESAVVLCQLQALIVGIGVVFHFAVSDLWNMVQSVTVCKTMVSLQSRMG
jgi:hypothetical protein